MVGPISLGTATILLFVFIAFGMEESNPMTDRMWGGHLWSEGTVLGWILLCGMVMQLLFLAVVIRREFIYRAVTTFEGGTDRALGEGRLASARSDLTDNEYKQRRDALKRGP
jgi:putative membrane protein